MMFLDQNWAKMELPKKLAKFRKFLVRILNVYLVTLNFHSFMSGNTLFQNRFAFRFNIIFSR